jgi:hypothetical protein
VGVACVGALSCLAHAFFVGACWTSVQSCRQCSACFCMHSLHALAQSRAHVCAAGAVCAVRVRCAVLTLVWTSALYSWHCGEWSIVCSLDAQAALPAIFAWRVCSRCCAGVAM